MRVLSPSTIADESAAPPIKKVSMEMGHHPDLPVPTILFVSLLHRESTGAGFTRSCAGRSEKKRERPSRQPLPGHGCPAATPKRGGGKKCNRLIAMGWSRGTCFALFFFLAHRRRQPQEKMCREMTQKKDGENVARTRQRLVARKGAAAATTDTPQRRASEFGREAREWRRDSAGPPLGRLARHRQHDHRQKNCAKNQDIYV